ncbi:MAG: SDR family NAD(P)-dependent oxidoreductase, partial [Alphaproteobacteria bacterium]|nr:SDR family NAD(P)-dependent oxidoreductase [Alphaproteobacteria bacterium]
MAQTPTALIVGVGASAGVGAATARRFAREGFHVVAVGRTPAKIDAVVAEIRAAGGSAEGLTGDASVEADATRVVAAADAAGALQVLVYNAG